MTGLETGSVPLPSPDVDMAVTVGVLQIDSVKSEGRNAATSATMDTRPSPSGSHMRDGRFPFLPIAIKRYYDSLKRAQVSRS